MEVTAQEKMEEVTKQLCDVVNGMHNAIRIDYHAQTNEASSIAIDYWNYFCVMYERCMMELDKLIPEDPLYWAQQQNNNAQQQIEAHNKILKQFKSTSKTSKLYPHLLNHQTAASKITDFEFWNDWLPALDYTYFESIRDTHQIFAEYISTIQNKTDMLEAI